MRRQDDLHPTVHHERPVTGPGPGEEYLAQHGSEIGCLIERATRLIESSCGSSDLDREIMRDEARSTILRAIHGALDRATVQVGSATDRVVAVAELVPPTANHHGELVVRFGLGLPIGRLPAPATPNGGWPAEILKSRRLCAEDRTTKGVCGEFRVYMGTFSATQLGRVVVEDLEPGEEYNAFRTKAGLIVLEPLGRTVAEMETEDKLDHRLDI